MIDCPLDVVSCVKLEGIVALSVAHFPMVDGHVENSPVKLGRAEQVALTRVLSLILRHHPNMSQTTSRTPMMQNMGHSTRLPFQMNTRAGVPENACLAD